MIVKAIFTSLFLTIAIVAYGQKVSTMSTPLLPLFSVGDTAYGYIRILNPSPSPTYLNKVALVSGVEFVIDSGPTLPFVLINAEAKFRVLFIPLSPGIKYDTAIFYFVENGRETTASAVVSGYADPLDVNEDILPNISPVSFEIISAYPNPTSGIVRCVYTIDEATDVSIELLDMLGKVIARPLAITHQIRGVHEVSFDVSSLPSGAYIARISGGGFVTSSRVIVRH